MGPHDVLTGQRYQVDFMSTGFAHSSVACANFGPPFYPLEYILRDAAVPDGQYHGDVGRTRYNLLGYPLLTGCSTQDSQLFGELMIQVLEKGVRRYGQ